MRKNQDLKEEVLRTLASSSVHGISHAATTPRKPFAVIWSLLFVVCVCVFVYNSSFLVAKLRDRTPDKAYELDKARFVFPDVYLCPTDPYSGSYPYVLSQNVSNLIISEIDRIIDRCREFGACYELMEYTGVWTAFLVQSSLPVHLMTEYLTQKPRQSVLMASLWTNNISLSNIDVELFSHPDNLICFKLALNDRQREEMSYLRSYLSIALSTDPYFPDFNFTGHEVKSFKYKTNFTPIQLRDWDWDRGADILKASGYKVLMVPQGAYPSMSHEHSVQISPGNSYTMKVRMEKNFCTDELRGSHCASDPPEVAFRDQLTGNKTVFNYSYASCFYKLFQESMAGQFQCLDTYLPTPWELRHFPRCSNLTEMNRTLFNKYIFSSENETGDHIELQAAKACAVQIPCLYSSYESKFSFDRWPNPGSAARGIACHLQLELLNRAREDMPAFFKLSELASILHNSSHSAHLEGIFRSYVSEALVRVKISAETVMSSQVTMAWSYSILDFLADTGGLIGLYIGFSILTFCELIELLWAVCMASCPWCRPEQTQTDGEPTETAEKATDNPRNEIGQSIQLHCKVVT